MNGSDNNIQCIERHFAGGFLFGLGCTSIMVHMASLTAMFRLAHKYPSFIFLISLSIADVVFVASFTVFGLCIMNQRNLMGTISWHFGNLCAFAMDMYYVMTAINRFCANTCLEYFKIWFTTRNNLILCFIMWSLAITEHYALVTVYGTFACFDPNRFGIVILLSDPARLQSLSIIYIVQHKIAIVVPCLLYAILFCRILYTNRSFLTSSRITLKKDLKLALACAINSLCLTAVSYVASISLPESIWDHWWRCLIHMFYANVNPLLYITMGATIRNEIRHIFLSCPVNFFRFLRFLR